MLITAWREIDVVRTQSEQLAAVVRHPEPVGFVVDMPQADIGGDRGKRHALFALPRGRLGVARFVDRGAQQENRN